MASYLRPRRGKKATAESQAIVLKKGEVFFEIAATGISTGSSATACGKIKMGDGSTTYSNLGYFIDVDTSVVAFTDTATATSAAQGADYYAGLNAIAPTATVKSIFGNVKSLLYKLSTNVTQLNNDLTASDDLKFRFATDGAGNYGYLKADDSFIPFSTGGGVKFIQVTIQFTFGYTNTFSGMDQNFNTFSGSFGWNGYDTYNGVNIGNIFDGVKNHNGDYYWYGKMYQAGRLFIGGVDKGYVEAGQEIPNIAISSGSCYAILIIEDSTPRIDYIYPTFITNAIGSGGWNVNVYDLNNDDVVTVSIDDTRNFTFPQENGVINRTSRISYASGIITSTVIKAGYFISDQFAITYYAAGATISDWRKYLIYLGETNPFA